MRIRIGIPALTVLLCMLFVPGLRASTDDLSRMRAAGIGERVILAVERERAIQTGLVTIEQLAELKRAGVSDDTIVTWIEERSFVRERGRREYGFQSGPMRPLDFEQVLQLKEAGVSDELLQSFLFGLSENAEMEQRRRALDMLQNLGIILVK